MRIAFVSIPRFPCAVEALRDPPLSGRPLIVGDAEAPKRVLDCSEQAALAGVRQGMTIRQALGSCPEAVVVPPDPVLYRLKWEAILDVLHGISPEIEDEEMGRAYVNAGGLEAHYRDGDSLAAHIVDSVRDGSGLTPCVGIAGGKFPALAIASSLRPGETGFVPAGGEADLLSPLNVQLLPIEPEIIFQLELFGLRTLGEVARLTLPELQSQFGFEGKRIWQLVRGLDEEPLRARLETEKVEASWSFESAVAGVDVMVEVSKQLLSRLRVPLRGRAVRELTLQAELESGRGWEHRIVLREAVSEDERLMFVLRSSLLNTPPSNAVRSIALRLGGLTGETGKQLSLGDRARVQRHLQEAIRQLKARYGYSPIFRCVEVEPWSVIPEDRQILVESDA